MKKDKNNYNEIAPEYDFSNGVRGKHHQKMTEGYTVIIYSPNKNAFENQVVDKSYYIKIDKEINDFFKTSENINNALRSLISVIPQSNRKIENSIEK